MIAKSKVAVQSQRSPITESGAGDAFFLIIQVYLTCRYQRMLATKKERAGTGL